MNTNINITWAQFLLDFPEFNTLASSNPTLFQFIQSQFNYYFDFAQLMLDPQGRASVDLVNKFAELFIAHHMVLEALALRDMQAGGIPGVAKGAVAGKSARDVSITYAVQATLELSAGHWNYTVYGLRFKRLADYLGAGPIQVGPGGGGCFGAGAWPGPNIYPPW